jgi:hypothetical protein
MPDTVFWPYIRLIFQPDIVTGYPVRPDTGYSVEMFAQVNPVSGRIPVRISGAHIIIYLILFSSKEPTLVMQQAGIKLPLCCEQIPVSESDAEQYRYR